jgi:lipopolysaccharide export system permease protein
MDFLRSCSSRLILILALVALGVGLCAVLVPMESRAVEQQLLGFPDSDIGSHQARPLVLGALCFLPALTALAYALGGTLDRYIFRQFLGIFCICISGLFMIWLLVDLTDKINEFLASGRVLHTLGEFYLTRCPSIFLALLPYSLLLALLYSLGKLSAHREVIAMIQSGRGIFRLTRPLIIAGVLCVLFGLGINYHWAPVSEGAVDDILAEASGKKTTEATQVLFRNSANRRLWMIGAFPSDYQLGQALINVEVTTTDDHQMLVSRISADRALWDRVTHQWTFEGAVLGIYSADNPPVFRKFATPLVINTWSETPWQLIKPGLSPSYLGIPDLSTWLHVNASNHGFADPAPYLTHWHYRWALPFTCLVTVLLAAPLGIYFSRRGPGGGIFLAVVLSAVMLLVSNVVLAFGEAGKIPAPLAAWLPNLLFTLIGVYLFILRITGRPIYQSLRKLVPGSA